MTPVSDSLTDRVITDNPLQGKVLDSWRKCEEVLKVSDFVDVIFHVSSVALSVNP